MLGGLEKTQPEVALLLQNLVDAASMSKTSTLTTPPALSNLDSTSLNTSISTTNTEETRIQSRAIYTGFPNAILLAGENYSGRMFAATQICKAMKVPMENVLIISDRNHRYRIGAALNLYQKNKNSSAKKFLKDSFSILLSQYQGALLEAQSTTAGKKKFSDAADVAELLNEIDNIDQNKIDSYVDDLRLSFEKLLDPPKSPITYTNSIPPVKKSTISIPQVRAIIDWCLTSSMDGKAKFVIIEGLENAGAPAINSLLKTLEETPKNAHFILISSNPGRIPATILSRVRRFQFKELGDKEKNYILNSLFVNPKDYPTLESFFIKTSGIDDDLLLQAAQNLLRKKEVNLPKLVDELEKSQSWDRFFQHVINQTSVAFQEGRLDEKVSRQMLSEVANAVAKGKTFNQNKRLTLDFVIYRVKEILR